MSTEAINHAAEAWGIRCMRYEIRDINLPTKVKEAMQMQVEAERKKRANILDSEGMLPRGYWWLTYSSGAIFKC